MVRKLQALSLTIWWFSVITKTFVGWVVETAEMQSVYSTAPVDWYMLERILFLPNQEDVNIYLFFKFGNRLVISSYLLFTLFVLETCSPSMSPLSCLLGGKFYPQLSCYWFCFVYKPNLDNVDLGFCWLSFTHIYIYIYMIYFY